MRVTAARGSRELPLTWRGPGEGGEDTPHRAAARVGNGPRSGSRGCASALAAPWAGLRRPDSVRTPKRQAYEPHVRAWARRKRASGTRTFGERSENTELWL